MADPTNTLYRDAVLGLVRYLEVEVGRSTDGANTPLRMSRSVPSSEDGRQLFSPTNPASVTLGSAGAGLALDATLQTIAQGIASFAAANHVDLGALLTRLGQALTVQGTVNVGNLPATQAVSATALPLPAGAAKDTTVAGIVTALGNPLQAGGTITATQSGAWTVALGAGASAIGTVGVSSLPALPTGANTIGFVNQAGSWTVSLATGTTVTANLGTLNGAALDTSVQAITTKLGTTIKVDGSAVTQPISATTLPLPSGASTAANQSTAITNLANILTALTGTLKVISPLAAPVTGQVRITTTGTPVQLPSLALVNGLAIKAKMTNAAQGTNYSGMVGGSTVTTTYDGTGTGYPLAPGEGVSLAIANANQVYVNGTVGDVFTYSGN